MKTLRYVHAFEDRHGHARYYFRRHGKRTALLGQYGSSDFMAAYAAALDASNSSPVERTPKRAALPGTFDALAAKYFASPNFLRLTQTTQTNYRRVIGTFLEKHGQRLVAQMQRRHVDALIGAMSERPGAGIVLLKRLRTLCRYAMEIGWIDRDPTAGAQGYRSVEIHTWTEEEIASYEARWPSGSRERLAFALLLYTGQRGSDVHRMTWNDIAGDVIRVAQQKTATKLVIPLHPDLRSELAQTKRDHLAILSTAFGRAFSVKGFGNMMSDAIGKARLPDRCKAHGLRKAAARRLAELGCSEKEIGAITGHKTLAEIERYTRAASQERLARQAIERQVANKSGKLTAVSSGNPE